MERTQDSRLLKGIDEFNQELYFECHETLEEIWLEEHGEDRSFYQGIIQIAAGYYRLQQGVMIGAIKLWRMGLQKIEPYRPVHLDIDVEFLIEHVKENLAELESLNQERGSPPSLTVPTILRVS